MISLFGLIESLDRPRRPPPMMFIDVQSSQDLARDRVAVGKEMPRTIHLYAFVCVFFFFQSIPACKDQGMSFVQKRTFRAMSYLRGT